MLISLSASALSQVSICRIVYNLMTQYMHEYNYLTTHHVIIAIALYACIATMLQ